MAMLDASLLHAALVGYEQRLVEIDHRIAEIRKQLGGRAKPPVAGSETGMPKRVLSAAARRRIGAAQRKRWAAHRKAAAQAAK